MGNKGVPSQNHSYTESGNYLPGKGKRAFLLRAACGTGIHSRKKACQGLAWAVRGPFPQGQGNGVVSHQVCCINCIKKKRGLGRGREGQLRFPGTTHRTAGETCTTLLEESFDLRGGAVL